MKKAYSQDVEKKEVKSIKCSHCKAIKSLGSFAKDRTRATGFSNKCKDCNSSSLKAYREKNKDYLQKNKDWKKNNQEKYRNSERKRENFRLKNDIGFKLRKRLRLRIYECLSSKGIKKEYSFSKMLGCSPIELRGYLESKFQPGMSWDNYGLYGWHIDHIKPLSKFRLTEKKELEQACHYTNLQPLWAKDNLRKGNK